MPFSQLSQHLPFDLAPATEKQAYHICNSFLDFGVEPVRREIVERTIKVIYNKLNIMQEGANTNIY